MIIIMVCGRPRPAEVEAGSESRPTGGGGCGGGAAAGGPAEGLGGGGLEADGGGGAPMGGGGGIDGGSKCGPKTTRKYSFSLNNVHFSSNDLNWNWQKKFVSTKVSLMKKYFSNEFYLLYFVILLK